jgi:hypothetical protein
MFRLQESLTLPISTARFANVAFLYGSLSYAFNQRSVQHQPIAAELKHSEAFDSMRFSGTMVRYLQSIAMFVKMISDYNRKETGKHYYN